MSDWLTDDVERVLVPTIEGDSLVSVTDAAKLVSIELGRSCPAITIRKAMDRGELPYVLIARRMVLQRDTVIEWARLDDRRKTLAQDEYLRIVDDFNAGMSRKALARKYRRSRETIRAIVGKGEMPAALANYWQGRRLEDVDDS